MTTITNTATAVDDGANGADQNPADNSDSDNTPLVAVPDLQITKDDGGITSTVDGIVAYTLNYQNAGARDATGVVITETVPAGSR